MSKRADWFHWNLDFLTNRETATLSTTKCQSWTKWSYAFKTSNSISLSQLESKAIFTSETISIFWWRHTSEDLLNNQLNMLFLKPLSSQLTSHHRDKAKLILWYGQVRFPDDLQVIWGTWLGMTHHHHQDPNHLDRATPKACTAHIGYL